MCTSLILSFIIVNQLPVAGADLAALYQPVKLKAEPCGRRSLPPIFWHQRAAAAVADSLSARCRRFGDFFTRLFHFLFGKQNN